MDVYNYYIVSATPHHHCEENTYIVSLGHKDADHSEIEKRYISDIKSINESPEKNSTLLR